MRDWGKLYILRYKKMMDQILINSKNDKLTETDSKNLMYNDSESFIENWFCLQLYWMILYSINKKDDWEYANKAC